MQNPYAPYAPLRPLPTTCAYTCLRNRIQPEEEEGPELPELEEPEEQDLLGA